MRFLTAPAARLRHTAGFLRSFAAIVALPTAENVMTMERHASALARPQDLRDLEDMVMGNDATRALVEGRWVPAPYTLEDLERCPAGSLGAAYLHHMRANGLDVDYFPEFDADRIDEFLRVRLYQTHDIFHCIAGYGTSYEEELGIVGFCLAQYLRLPHRGELLAAFMGILATAVLLHGTVTDPRRMRSFFDHFVDGYQRGRASKDLVGPRWEELLDRPLAELQAELHIPPRTESTAAWSLSEAVA